MKAIFSLFIGVLAVCGSQAQGSGTAADRAGLLRTTTAIRDAFARGDIDAILALHHPDVIKYFGGNTVVKGREGLLQQLSGWLGKTTSPTGWVSLREVTQEAPPK
jgi:Domain of unknown function (DUF4440)